MTRRKPPQYVADGRCQSSNGGIDRNIIDIRTDRSEIPLAEQIRAGLKDGRKTGRSLPSMLLWNEKGLELFEAVAHLDEYYVARTETEILERHAADMAQRIPSHCMVIELGSGNPAKIKHLLRALDDLGRSIDYFALDLCFTELQSSLNMLCSEGFNHVRCHGLLGTYDDGRAWMQLPENLQRSKCIVSLGSSIGNFTPHEAVEFLSVYAETLQYRGPPSERHQVQSESLFIIGLDPCKTAETVHRAYNDLGGFNARFNMNSLEHANKVLGYKAFRTEEWTVRGEWDERTRCFNQSLIPVVDVMFEGICLKAGEKVHISHSYKYDAAQKAQLWRQAGLKELAGWRCKDSYYGTDPRVSMLEIAHTTN